MSTYIHHSHFETLRRAHQAERNLTMRLLDSLISWTAAALLIGTIGGCCYLFYLLLLKELTLIR